MTSPPLEARTHSPEGTRRLAAAVAGVLEAGDLIDTGTPPGVGMGFTPPVWLQPGDVMELGIDELGSQRQHVIGPR